VSRLICGGNSIAGFSHQGVKLDFKMLRYYTMANIQELLGDSSANRNELVKV